MSKKREKDPGAVALGRRGGQARIHKLTAEQRKSIAQKAARARWSKVKTKEEKPT
jgi:hypothetical protein